MGGLSCGNGEAAGVGAVAVESTDAVWGELVAEAPLGMLLLDRDGVVVAGNRTATGLLGADLIGRGMPTERFTPDGAGAPLPSAADLVGQVLRMDSQLAMPVLVDRGELSDVRLWVTYYPVCHGGRPRVVVVLRPVHSTVGHVHGMLDPLTGLPNRALLLDRLDQALVRARTHGTLATVVLLDVCGMGQINSSFGFARGDVLLGVLAGRLRAGLPDDYTVARYGGDRFAVVAEHPSGTGAPIAARVRDVVRRSVRLGGRRLGPNARVRWATSDGSTPTHSVIAQLESVLDG